MNKKISYNDTVVKCPNIITKKECEKIKKIYEKNKEKEKEAFYEIDGEIKNSPKGLFKKNIKNNLIMETNNKIINYVKEFNKKFMFDINYKDQSRIRLLKYENNQKCDWHIDLADYPRNNYKIDSILMLSDKNEYQGGNLKFFLGSEIEVELNQGDLILFLPFIYHKVEEVTQGERYVMVNFFSGKNPLK